MKRIVKLWIKTFLILGSSLALFYYAIGCYGENHAYNNGTMERSNGNYRDIHFYTEAGCIYSCVEGQITLRRELVDLFNDGKLTTVYKVYNYGRLVNTITDTQGLIIDVD